MDRSVVFAMGSPHSGTSLLTLILGSHSRAFALGEMEDFKGSSRCRVCEDRCPIWTPGFSRGFARRRFGRGHRAFLTRVSPFAKGFYEQLFEVTGADILVDSVQAGDMARDAAGDAARLAPRPAVLHLHRPRRARGGELVEAQVFPDPGGGMGGAVGAQRGSHAEGLRRLRAGAAAADLVRGAGLAPRAHGGTAVRVPGHRVRAPHGRLLDARASRLQGQQRHDLADQAPSRGAGSGQGGKRRAR